MKEYLSKIDRAPVLSELESIYSFDNTNSKDKNINQILIGYLFTESNGNKELFLYRLKKSLLIKNSGFWIFGKKISSTNAEKIKIDRIKNGFNLPTSKKDCLASIYKRKDTSEGKQYKIKIFKAYDFDEVFQTCDTKHKYVDRILEKFESANNPISLTKEQILVKFKTDELPEIKNCIYNDDNLTRTFASFHDNKNRIIKNISLEKLKQVLKVLKLHVENNADAGFNINNIPVLTTDNKLEVTSKSIPTFAALLDNKVIQRLLDNTIEIPYFKSHSVN